MNIFKNISIKALAFVAAIFLWFFVVGVENYVFLSQDAMTVKVLNLGKNVSVANELPGAKIRYKNESGVNVKPNASDFDLYLDASGLGEGEYQLPIRFTSRDSKVVVVAVEPAVLGLKLEAITSKEIGLKAEVTGSPAKDYEIKEISTNLDKIKLSGAASAIAKIKDLNLKVSLDGNENADFSRKITLDAPTDWKLAGKTVSFDPSVVQVEIKVRKVVKPVAGTGDDMNNNDGTVGNSGNTPVESGMQRKTLMVKVLSEAAMKSAVKELVPSNILVTLEGLPDDLAQLTGDSLSLIIHSSNVSKGVYEVNPNDLELPQGLKLKVIELSPAKIAVKF